MTPSKLVFSLLAPLALAACWTPLEPQSKVALNPAVQGPVSEPGSGTTPGLPGEEPDAPEPDPGSPSDLPAFGPVVHPFFPVVPGTVWVYEGTSDGAFRRDIVRVLPGTRRIMDVECSALYQELYLDGVLVERSTEWYAGDAEGNLWKFGEESFDLESGVPVLTEDSWEAGVDGVAPWIFFTAQPRPGEVTTNGDEVVQIVSVSAIAEMPAGLFRDCLEAVENPTDEEDRDVIIYAPGTGLVSESSTNGKIELVSLGNG